MVGAITDGGIGTEPWQIPRLGASSGKSPVPKSWSQSPTGEPSQGNASTGVGGLFAPATTSWLPSGQHRGLYGGWGIRTGGYA